VCINVLAVLWSYWPNVVVSRYASANPKYLAITVDPVTGIVQGYRSTSDTALTTGETLIPWVDMCGNPELTPLPRHQQDFKLRKLKLHQGKLKLRDPTDLDADQALEKSNENKARRKELKKQLQTVKDALKADPQDADMLEEKASIQSQLDALK
jgi:hypothetical protein